MREIAPCHVAQVGNGVIERLRYFCQLMQNHGCVCNERLAHALIKAVHGFVVQVSENIEAERDED